MTIEVKNCQECPLINSDFEGIRDNCNHPNGVSVNKTIQKWINLPSDKVHDLCPLKTEPITVKIKEDE